ncbi:TPA: 16S rRNA processing protein RimM [Streptococcus suis]|nr:16S rRNA processing protein RimM [Streptococcus suis]HEM3699861.1 16S rRNA processing protein RimM [Streptococcus suis]
MAILNDLKNLYDNGWDASFVYKGQDCAILPNSTTDIQVCIGPNTYTVSSFDDLVALEIDGRTLSDIMSETDVQYY